MKGWLAHALVTGVALALGGACGGSDSSGSGGAGGSPVPLSALGDAYEEVLCHYFMQCAGVGYRSLEECKADRAPTGLGDIEAAVGEGRIVYDAAQVGACRAAMDAHICDLPYLFVPTIPDVLGDCLKDPGRQPSGGPCRDDIECASGLYCSMQDYTCPGVCRPLLQEGDACASGSELRCGPPPPVTLTLPELYSMSPDELQALVDQYAPLDLDCVGGKCEAPIPIGGSCSTDSTCLDEGYCGDSGTCEAPVDVGGACGASSPACKEGLFCLLDAASSAGTCAPIGGNGDPCIFTSHCEDGLVCKSEPGVVAGTCAPPGARGEACGGASDCAEGLACRDDGTCDDPPGQGQPCGANECADGLTCPGDVCVPLVHPGDACNDTDAICLGRCVDGTCTARVALGGACVVNDDCTSRACVDGVCVDDELCEYRTGSGGG